MALARFRAMEPPFPSVFFRLLIHPFEFWRSDARRVSPAIWLPFTTAMVLVGTLVAALIAALVLGTFFDDVPAAAIGAGIPIGAVCTGVTSWLLLAMYAVCCRPQLRTGDATEDLLGWAVAGAASLWMPLWQIVVGGQVAAYIASSYFWVTVPLPVNTWLFRGALLATGLMALHTGCAASGLLISRGASEIRVAIGTLAAVVLNPAHLLLLFALL